MTSLNQTRSRNRWDRYRFDHRSVVLFAALSIAGTASVHAQAGNPFQGSGTVQPAAPAGGNVPNAPGALPLGGSHSLGSALGVQTPAAAFDRADANKDGRLSPTEAATLPAIGNRFEALDTNKDGFLSREEFERGARS